MKLTILSICIAVLAIIGAIFLVPKHSSQANLNNVTIENGIQIIEIDAKGGYSPRVTDAKARIDTVLKVKTNGTFDCSLSLAIPSIQFRKILPQTGETEIPLGSPTSGTVLNGLCGMGMYNFAINFK